MKGEITLKILETIRDVLYLPTDLMTAILVSGYGASMSKMERNLNQLQEERERGRAETEERYRLSKLLYKLKKDGLVKKNENNFLCITKKGLRKLIRLKFRHSQRNYQKQKDDSFKIVAFDIPEKDRGKRSWLRASLTSLGFIMLQKSVWIGKVKLPEVFIADMQAFGLISYTEIFSINKSGTIKQLA